MGTTSKHRENKRSEATHNKIFMKLIQVSRAPRDMFTLTECIDVGFSTGLQTFSTINDARRNSAEVNGKWQGDSSQTLVVTKQSSKIKTIELESKQYLTHATDLYTFKLRVRGRE